MRDLPVRRRRHDGIRADLRALRPRRAPGGLRRGCKGGPEPGPHRVRGGASLERAESVYRAHDLSGRPSWRGCGWRPGEKVSVSILAAASLRPVPADARRRLHDLDRDKSSGRALPSAPVHPRPASAEMMAPHGGHVPAMSALARRWRRDRAHRRAGALPLEPVKRGFESLPAKVMVRSVSAKKILGRPRRCGGGLHRRARARRRAPRARLDGWPVALRSPETAKAPDLAAIVSGGDQDDDGCTPATSATGCWMAPCSDRSSHRRRVRQV